MGSVLPLIRSDRQLVATGGNGSCLISSFSSEEHLPPVADCLGPLGSTNAPERWRASDRELGRQSGGRARVVKTPDGPEVVGYRVPGERLNDHESPVVGSESEPPAAALYEFPSDLGEPFNCLLELVEVGSDHHWNHHPVEIPLTTVLRGGSTTGDCG